MEHKYIISDVSKLLDIEPHVLRYWEDELGLNINRNQLGHRYYSEKDMEVLKKIKILKEQGYQLRAIKMVLNSSNQSNEANLEESHFPVGFKELSKEGQLSEEVNVLKKGLEEADSQEMVAQYNYKLKQFERFFKDVVYLSLQENNKLLKEEISEAFMAKVQPMVAKQEELDEKHYRKLDETIREIQKVRQEIAASAPKRKKWFKGKTNQSF